MFSAYDFGYAWPWTCAHLIPAALSFVLAVVLWRIRWRRSAIVAAGLLLWALAAQLAVHLVFRINRPMLLPTPNFLASGSGRVLDIGAGSGRSALMVLLARPQATVTALDDFSAPYIRDHGPEHTRANARIAGAADRLDIVSADMRRIPLPDASYDAAVSAYAIDHLRRGDIPKALTEVARVLRPSGQFLLIVQHPDRWVRFAYPLIHAHMYYGRRPARDLWIGLLTDAGFGIMEEGYPPGSLSLLAVKR